MLRIAASARKHGISDERIVFALDHSVWVRDRGSAVIMYWGYDHNLIPIELVLVHRGDDVVIIHAMKLRTRWVPNFWSYL